jgi:putative hydrolase of the HAD superfamily
MHASLSHIDTWIFDLDLTLYGPEHNIMEQVRTRIAAFVADHFDIDAEAAHKIRYDYWKKYGTTLCGLIAEHDVEPQAYLDFVHDVDLSLLQPCEQLRAGLQTLPGRKLIFTNADAPYAKRVLALRGLGDVFEDIFDIHRMDHRPKPDNASYDVLCTELAINPATALFVEDSVHNLEPAKACGMTTIWINHAAEAETNDHRPQYVDYEITDLAKWLKDIREKDVT